MPRQNDRYHRLIIGPPGGAGLLVTHEDLDIVAKVKKKSNSTNDKADIEIIKLGAFHRQRLERMKGLAISLDCGYKENHGLVFKGALLNAWSEKRGSDWVTFIKGEDYTRKMARTVLSIEVNADTSSKSVINKVADALGVKIGSLTLKGLKDPKDKTVPLVGPAKTVLNQLCASIGAYWHITDGLLYIAPLGAASRQDVILISPDTGMIGSPSATTDGMEFEHSFLHNANPGKLVRVNSRDIKNRDGILVEVDQKYQSYGTTATTAAKSLYRNKVLAS